MGDCATAGDSGAIGVTVKTRDCTQRHFVGHLLPAQGLGVPCAPGINDRRVTHKVCCVKVPVASPHANPVSGDCVTATTSPGHFVSGESRQREAITSESPPMERSGMLAG